MITLICICLVALAIGVALGYVCSLQDRKIKSLLEENEKLLQKCKQSTDELYRLQGMVQNLQRKIMEE